jgi:hypothetical protein
LREAWGRVSAVLGELILESVDPQGKRVDHLSLLVDLSEEEFYELDDGVGTLLIHRQDVLASHHKVGA